MALDLESLRYDAGMSRRSASFSGIGKQGGTKAWAQTYDKIMNSNESVSFYLIAAQEHLDYNTAKEFALSTAVENLRKEQTILKIIEPLGKSTSAEANRIYNEITSTFGLSTEGIGDKIKETGKKIWRTIVEAFRKIKLAIVNIIQAIRKGLASIFNGGDSKKYIDNWDRIVASGCRNGVNAKKTIKVKAASKSCWIFPAKNNQKFEDLANACSEHAEQVAHCLQQMDVNKLLSSPASSAEKIIKDIENSTNEFMKRAGAGVSKTYNTMNVAGQGAGKMGNPISFILYGTTKPKEQEIKIAYILGYPYAKTLIDNKTLEAVKMISKSLDVTVNAISKIISNAEKFIQKTDTIDSKTESAAVLRLMKGARGVLNTITLASRELFIQFIKLRKTVMRAANIALAGIEDDDFKKDNKNKNKKTW